MISVSLRLVREEFGEAPAERAVAAENEDREPALAHRPLSSSADPPPGAVGPWQAGMSGARPPMRARMSAGKGALRREPRFDVHADLLAGRGDESFVEVEQRLEEVEALGVVVEDDRLDDDAVACLELAEVADMGLEGEDGMIGLRDIVFVDADAGEDLVESPVEENVVVGHVEVAVIVDPVRFDGHDRGADRRLGKRAPRRARKGWIRLWLTIAILLRCLVDRKSRVRQRLA